uniref:LIM zinc-binding domain-containing protein n=1 Tax=Salmo trutta TaxID=8032 RepID=A0A673ZTQ9_SALTR
MLFYCCEKKRSLGRDYHPLCLKCQQCQRQCFLCFVFQHDEKPYCTNCYMKMFGTRGRYCLVMYFSWCASQMAAYSLHCTLLWPETWSKVVH